MRLCACLFVCVCLPFCLPVCCCVFFLVGCVRLFARCELINDTGICHWRPHGDLLSPYFCHRGLHYFLHTEVDMKHTDGDEVCDFVDMTNAMMNI